MQFEINIGAVYESAVHIQNKSKMKIPILVLCCAYMAASLPFEPHVKIANKEYLTKQKDILRLLNYVNQPSYYPEIIETANNFKFEGQWDQWTKPEFAQKLWKIYTNDMLPRGEIFSIFYPEHLEQAIALFRAFYYVKDYSTFFKVASWARQNVNEGMFVYCINVVVVHAPFLHEIVLPPIYETYPHYFFNDDVVYKAQQYKQHKYEKDDDDQNGYVIRANYSGLNMNVNEEQKITYFTEDIGVNADYYYHYLYAPFWLKSDETFYKGAFRGEYFFWFHQQFLARYYLERLSNGMSSIPTYEYEYPIETGYYPAMTYPNGMHFPTRPNHADIHTNGGFKSWYGNYSNSYSYVKDYERRLRDALDTSFVVNPKGEQVNIFQKGGLELFGDIVESNVESINDRFYGDLLIFSRHLLGYSYYPLDQYKVAPSALEHYETSLRDPMFWQLSKRIMYYFYQYQNYQGPYKSEELNMEGVKITDIKVDHIVTFFNDFYTDISNLVRVNEKEFLDDSFKIKAVQKRLNYKPFDYSVLITSTKTMDAMIKVYIGPKFDEFGRNSSIEDNRKNFYEIDRFKYSLKEGQNVATRNSHNFIHFSRERTTWKKFEEVVEKALNGQGEFRIFDDLTYYGFPKRMIMPKGAVGGMDFQFYAIAVPFHPSPLADDATNYLVDVEYSIGYPFDRPIEFESDFKVPNSCFKDVVIYHKTVLDDKL